MYDQLIIGDKASFDDFLASVAYRKIGMPPKKSIKEQIPFSNITYDFSRIDGELYWEERELEYTFEITASAPERLEELKQAFISWVMNVFEEQIKDPFIPDYYFVGTFSDIEVEDEEGLDKTAITVVFTAYPYMIANLPKVYTLTVPVGGNGTILMQNESSHRISPTITIDGEITILLGGGSYVVSGGELDSDMFLLEPGNNEMSFKNHTNAVRRVTITFYEEVF